jgi:hypothetical protein
MAERKLRFKVIEKYLTIAILADTLFFILYLIFAGSGKTGAKVAFVILCLLVSLAVLAFLYIRKELFRGRSLWMTLAAAAIVLLVLLSLILNFPSPKPLVPAQAAALLDIIHI